MAWASRYYFPQDPEMSLPLPGYIRRVSGEHIPPPSRKEYQVQIPGCTELAGCAVKDKRVRLSKGEAQYWLDQGVLGDSAGEHKAGAALGLKQKK